MKSSFHSLIRFLPLFSNCQFRRLDSIPIPLLPRSYPGTMTSRSSTIHFRVIFCTSLSCRTLLYNHYLRTRIKHSIFIVEKVCLLSCCLAVDVLLLRAYAHAGMCLPSRCLAMGVHVTILKHTPSILLKLNSAVQ
jgi:hypothetical protein